MFTPRAQFLEIADDDAVYSLHDHDIDPAVVPVNFRHVQQRRAGKIALQLRGVAGFAQQVQFIENGLAVFAYQVDRAQAARLHPVLIGELGEILQHLEIEIDDLAHSGAQYFDYDFAAAFERGHVHLGNRGRGERRRLEA